MSAQKRIGYMDSVNSLWEDEVPIEEWTAEDFAPRDANMFIRDKTGVYQYVASQCANQIGLTVSEWADFAVRLYSAYLLDTDENDIRAMLPQTVVLPPEWWRAEYEDSLPVYDDIEFTANEEYAAQWTVNTTDVVKEVVTYFIEEYDKFDSISEFIKYAISYQFITHGELLHEMDSVANVSYIETR